MTVRFDLHTHTTYSDGWVWTEMASAAADAGLDGIGFADHCPVGPDDYGRRANYNFAETFQLRREEFAEATELDVRVVDGAEVNYDPAKEAEIEAFLVNAGFEYTIGSVHFTDEFDIASPDLAEASRETRRTAVERYVTWQVKLIESELFDVVSHLDLVQRSPQLRGLMTTVQYERIADALADSTTIPELNAGRLDRRYGLLHPHPDRLPLFADRNIHFVVGTDAHAPDQLRQRLALLEERLPDLPVTIVDLPPAVEWEGDSGVASSR